MSTLAPGSPAYADPCFGGLFGGGPDLLHTVSTAPGSAYALKLPLTQWDDIVRHGAQGRKLRFAASVGLSLDVVAPPTMIGGQSFIFSDVPPALHTLDFDSGKPEAYNYTGEARGQGIIEVGASIDVGAVGTITNPGVGSTDIRFNLTLSCSVHPFSLVYGGDVYARTAISIGASGTWDTEIAGPLLYEFSDPEGIEPPHTVELIPGGGTVSSAGTGFLSKTVDLLRPTGGVYATITLAGIAGTFRPVFGDVTISVLEAHSDPPPV